MRECVKLLSHSLMQRGSSMRQQAPEPAAASRSLVNVFDTGSGRKVRSDNKTMVARGTPGPETSATTCRLRQLRWKQARAPWRVHQSVPCDKQGKCDWENCPGRKRTHVARARGRDTYKICEECSAMAGNRKVYLCNERYKGSALSCHLAYHQKYFNLRED